MATATCSLAHRGDCIDPEFRWCCHRSRMRLRGGESRSGSSSTATVTPGAASRERPFARRCPTTGGWRAKHVVQLTLSRLPVFAHSQDFVYVRLLDRILYRYPFEGASARRYAAMERPAFGDLDDRVLDTLFGATEASG